MSRHTERDETQPSSAILRHATTAEAKKTIIASYAGAEVFRERAVAILQNKWKAIHTRQTATEAYNLPAYSEFQADCNASLRTIEEVLNELFNVGGKTNG